MFESCWEAAGYVFRFRKGGPCVLGVLSVSSDRLPLPYHLIVTGLDQARRMAPSVIRAFENGLVPPEGVFRLEKARRGPHEIRALVRVR